MEKNRLILLGMIVALVVVVFVSITVLIAIGRDTEQVTTFALIVIPIVITAGGLGVVQINQNEKLDKIGKNVNGNMTKLIDHTVAQQTQTGPIAYANPMPEVGEDTIQRIRSDVDELPKHSA